VHPRIIDGSGLSRDDHSSPQELADLLRDVWHTPAGTVLWNSLPVVGVSGTTRTIATGTPAQGRCVAKTGTLDNVTNLAGYCNSRGGHLLSFALFIDGPSNWQALVLLGQMVAAIAKY
jgi:D-alanyl-D-alanine carboxypeptidase/D-alanyl-D-alanine-endopeptidase (penicillin-binding protein 4)